MVGLKIFHHITSPPAPPPSNEPPDEETYDPSLTDSAKLSSPPPPTLKPPIDISPSETGTESSSSVVGAALREESWRETGCLNVLDALMGGTDLSLSLSLSPSKTLR